MIDVVRKAKLQWNCRRGILELDLILQRFCHHCIDNLNYQEILALEKLLKYPDQELYLILLGRDLVYEKDLIDIVKLIQLQSSFH